MANSGRSALDSLTSLNLFDSLDSLDRLDGLELTVLCKSGSEFNGLVARLELFRWIGDFGLLHWSSLGHSAI